MAAPQVPVTNGEVDVADINSAFTEVNQNIETHKAKTNNPHGVTAAQVGLGNADNTPDVDKPVSTAQQAALNGKSDTGHGHEIAEVSGLTEALAAKVLQADLNNKLTMDVVRPGEGPAQFSAQLTGDPAQRPVIVEGLSVVDDDLGAVWSLPGAASIAPRRAYALELGRVYRLCMVVKRLENSSDPNNDAVEIRWQNLNKAKGAVSNVALHTYSALLVATGAVEFTALISRDVGGVDYVPPATARYGLPELRTYGGDGKVGIASVVWEDVTEEVAIAGDVEGLQALKAPLASPALTGVPTAPTAVPGTNSTQLATTEFIQAALAALVEAAPGTLDTLNELAAALGDDSNFAATVASALALKAPLDAPSFQGIPESPTAAPGTDTNQIASTSFVQAAVAVLSDVVAMDARVQNDPLAPAQAVRLQTVMLPSWTGVTTGGAQPGDILNISVQDGDDVRMPIAGLRVSSFSMASSEREQEVFINLGSQIDLNDLGFVVGDTVTAMILVSAYSHGPGSFESIGFTHGGVIRDLDNVANIGGGWQVWYAEYTLTADDLTAPLSRVGLKKAPGPDTFSGRLGAPLFFRGSNLAARAWLERHAPTGRHDKFMQRTFNGIAGSVTGDDAIWEVCPLSAGWAASETTPDPDPNLGEIVGADVHGLTGSTMKALRVAVAQDETVTVRLPVPVRRSDVASYQRPWLHGLIMVRTPTGNPASDFAAYRGLVWRNPASPHNLITSQFVKIVDVSDGWQLWRMTISTGLGSIQGFDLWGGGLNFPIEAGAARDYFFGPWRLLESDRDEIDPAEFDAALSEMLHEVNIDRAHLAAAQSAAVAAQATADAAQAQSSATDALALAAAETRPKGASLGRFLSKLARAPGARQYRTGVEVATVGDSISAGLNVSAIGAGQDGGAVVFSGNTAAEMDVDFTGVEARFDHLSWVWSNFATAGSTVREQSLEFIGRYAHRAPDLIYVHTGINGSYVLSDEQWPTEMDRLLRSVRQTTSADIILTTHIPVYLNGEDTAVEYYSNARRAQVRALAALHKCELIDWFEEFDNYLAAHPSVSLGDLYSGDGVHPSAFGYMVMRRILSARFLEVNSESRVDPNSLALQGPLAIDVSPAEAIAYGTPAPSSLSVPAAWSVFEYLGVRDPVANTALDHPAVPLSDVCLTTSGAAAMSVDFEGGRAMVRVRGTASGGALLFQIDGEAPSALGIWRVTPPVADAGNHIPQNTGVSAALYKPWTCGVSGPHVEEAFTITFTSDTTYTVTGSVSGALTGVGDILATSVFTSPGGGVLTFLAAFWTRKYIPPISDPLDRPFRSGDLFTFEIINVGTDSIDTATIPDGEFQWVEIAHRVPKGQHTLTIAGDGAGSVSLDLLRFEI